MSFRANNLIWFESQQEEVVHVPKVMQHERQHHFHVEDFPPNHSLLKLYSSTFFVGCRKCENTQLKTCVNFPCCWYVVYSRVLSMVHSTAIWVYRALELTALTRRENAVGRRGRDQFHIGSGAGSGSEIQLCFVGTISVQVCNGRRLQES